MKRTCIFLVTLACAVAPSVSTGALAPGDIAIIGFNFDNPDEFVFVALADLPAAEVIHFTDKGWLAAGGLRAGEGIEDYTVPGGGITGGTIVQFTPAGPDMLFSVSGDQILAYQSDATSTTFIYAVNSEGTGWQADATSANTSALPPGLTNGVNAVAVNEIDNAIFDTNAIPSGTKTEWLAAIGNTANWSGSNSTRQQMPSGSINLTGGVSSNAPPVLTAIGPKSVSDGDALVFEVTATDILDADDITLSASNLPAGAVFEAVTNAVGVTNTFNWASATPVGVYTTTFYAVDDDGATTEDVEISVLPEMPPTLNPIGNQAAVLSNLLQFTVTAVPTDGDAITELSATNLPGDATFVPTDGDNTNATFTWTAPDPVGVYTTTFFAVDNDGTNSEVVEITVSAPVVTTLIISEIIQNPAAVSDSAGEWFEIFNTTMSPIDINGWTIQDDGSDSHVITNGASLNVPAEGFLVLGRNADTGSNGGAPVDYQYADFFLSNGDDEVVLLNTDTVEVARVNYDGGATFPSPNGASMYLKGPELDQNVGANWGTSTVSVDWPGSAGDFGSPGAANEEGTWGLPPTNEPPVLVSIGPQAVTDGDALTFDVVATDTVDDDLVTLSASNLPAGATFATVTNATGVTNTFNWATATPAGVYTTTFYAVDVDGVDMEDVEITVSPQSPPVLNPVGNRSAGLSNTLQFVVSATPTDGDPITQLVASNLPGDATFIVGDGANTNATFTWTTPEPEGVYTTSFYAVDDDGASTEEITVTVQAVLEGVDAFINEVRFNSAGNPDTNSFVEIIAPAGTDLTGSFFVHHNGSSSVDAPVFQFIFPAFVMPSDGVTDTNGTALGFAVVAQAGGGVPNQDFDLPGDIQNGPDGIILYDAASNILDAVAWEGPGDLADDDPGTVTTNPPSSAPNFLHVTLDDGVGTDDSVQAPDDVRANDGSGWTLIPATPGAVNGGQTSGQIDLTGEGPPPPSDQPPVLAAIGNQSVMQSNALNFTVSATDTVDGDEVTLSASNLPPGAVFNTVTNVAGVTNDFTWAAPDPVGVYTTTFYAVDKDGAAMEEITITVDPPVTPFAGNVWINEFNYDGPASPETNEWIELVGEAGVSLDELELVLINGNGGAEYETFDLAGASFTFTDEDNGFGFFVIGSVADFLAVAADYTPVGWDSDVVQNGSPDSIQVRKKDGGANVHLVDYEGNNGFTTEDQFTSLAEGNPDDSTLFLTGGPGSGFGDFAWTNTANVATPGAVNSAQSLGAGGPADEDGDGISDDWELANCGSTTGCTANAQTGDEDGLTYLEEYILDFNPAVSNELFGFEEAGLGSVNVTFGETTNSRVYTVDATSDLTDSNGWVVVESSVTGSNGVTTVTDPDDLGARQYRVRVHVP